MKDTLLQTSGRENAAIAHDPANSAAEHSFHLLDQASELSGRVSKNGAALYVPDRETLQELYRCARLEDLIQHNSAGRSSQELELQAYNEAQGVEAFVDPISKRIVCLEPQESDRTERIFHASVIRHEEIHRRGGGELEAWKGQIEFLGRNGFAADLSTGTFVVRALGQGEAPVLQEDALRDYLARNYGASERVAALRIMRKDGVLQVSSPDDCIRPVNERHVDSSEPGGRWHRYSQDFKELNQFVEPADQQDRMYEICSNTDATRQVLIEGAPITLPKSIVSMTEPQFRDYGQFGAVEVRAVFKGEAVEGTGRHIGYLVRYHTDQAGRHQPPCFVIHREIPEGKRAIRSEMLVRSVENLERVMERYPNEFSRDASGNVWISEQLRRDAHGLKKGHDSLMDPPVRHFEAKAILDATHFHWVPQRWYKGSKQ